MHETAAELIEKLRKAIDAEYRQRIEALELLAKPIDTNDRFHPINIGRKRYRGNRREIAPTDIASGSHREKVFGVMTSEYQSVENIAQASGLEEKTVRGVLYAPSLKGKVKKRKRGKIAVFKKAGDVA